MRIVGGIYRGRVLKEFKGCDIRPTSDMTRESLFNILRNKVQGCVFLDLFCGTGAVGIEAISRGAKKVVFNDVSAESVFLTKNNLSKLGIDDGVEVRCGDANAFIESCNQKFDIIFIDAPYSSKAGENALNSVDKILADGGIVVYENEKATDQTYCGLKKYDDRRYGRAYLTFFEREQQ